MKLNSAKPHLTPLKDQYEKSVRSLFDSVNRDKAEIDKMREWFKLDSSNLSCEC